MPDPALAGDDDVVAIGGDLAPGTILAGYRKGMFPMHLPDGRLAWWSPVERGIIPPGRLQISRSLRRSLRRYEISFDLDPEGVIEGCADPTRPQGWITPEIQLAYLELFRLGWLHSVESWDQDGNLAGGLYGVAIGGLFAGESMFTRQRDASKVALVHLVGRLAMVENSLLDVQWVTPHLASLGAVGISRAEYLTRLREVLASPSPWENGSGGQGPDTRDWGIRRGT
ncbi:MAG: leucyl/phenylalanyl-tRNA--protein transferase [Acidimicrobiia bacterium]